MALSDTSSFLSQAAAKSSKNKYTNEIPTLNQTPRRASVSKGRASSNYVSGGGGEAPVGPTPG